MRLASVFLVLALSSANSTLIARTASPEEHQFSLVHGVLPGREDKIKAIAAVLACDLFARGVALLRTIVDPRFDGHSPSDTISPSARTSFEQRKWTVEEQQAAD